MRRTPEEILPALPPLIILESSVYSAFTQRKVAPCGKPRRGRPAPSLCRFIFKLRCFPFSLFVPTREFLVSACICHLEHMKVLLVCMMLLPGAHLQLSALQPSSFRLLQKVFLKIKGGGKRGERLFLRELPGYRGRFLF